MPDSSPVAETYDRIAHLYDVDMARNMPFDDVHFYAGLSELAGGRVLEIGCGNGRVLLELLRRGIDAYGVDRSEGMLAQLRRKTDRQALDSRVCQMDARALAFSNAFALILCPYSLVTYMVTELDLGQMLDGIRTALEASGRIIIDAFVPQSDLGSEGFQIDYRRAHGDALLTRSKRVAAIGTLLNRIERRYELVAADGTLLEQIETHEDIRPFVPQTLCELLVSSGFRVDAVWWNYASGEPPTNPRFFTVGASIA